MCHRREAWTVYIGEVIAWMMWSGSEACKCVWCLHVFEPSLLTCDGSIGERQMSEWDIEQTCLPKVMPVCRLQDMLKQEDFMRMPCGCAARLSMQPDFIGLQLGFMHSHPSKHSKHNAGGFLGEGEVAILSIGLSSTRPFTSQADTIILAQRETQAA